MTDLQVPSKHQVPGSSKASNAHSVTTISFYFLSHPLCKQSYLFAHEQKPAPLSWLFPVPCDTQTLGCHVPKPREGGDKAYGRKKLLFTHKELKK